MIRASCTATAAVLLLVEAGQATAATRDVNLLLAPEPAPAGGDINLTVSHAGSAEGAVATTSQIDGSADLSLRPGPSWNLIGSLGLYGLQLGAPVPVAAGVEIPARLAYQDIEVLPRYQNGEGTVIGCDLEGIYNHSPHAGARNRWDGTATAFVHPDARQATSWTFELLVTSQPMWHLPAILPGVAFCSQDPTLRYAIGFPFSYLDWTPVPAWELSGQIADTSSVTVLHHQGTLGELLTASWASQLLRLPTVDAKGDLLSYDEVTLCAGVQGTWGQWGQATLTLGRAFSRTMSDVTRSTIDQLGPAWLASASGEVDF